MEFKDIQGIFYAGLAVVTADMKTLRLSGSALCYELQVKQRRVSTFPVEVGIKRPPVCYCKF